jgi:hypothetical protein
LPFFFLKLSTTFLPSKFSLSKSLFPSAKLYFFWVLFGYSRDSRGNRWSRRRNLDDGRGG